MPFNPSLLNSTLVKKFIDRLEKSYKDRGVAIKRTSVQEDVANMFGFASYYEMKQNISSNRNAQNEQNFQFNEITENNTIETFQWFSEQIVLNPIPYVASPLFLPTIGVTLPAISQHRPQNVKELSDCIKVFTEHHLEILSDNHLKILSDKSVGSYERNEMVQYYCGSMGVFGFNSEHCNAAQRFLYIMQRSTAIMLYEQDQIVTGFLGGEIDVSPPLKKIMGLR